MKNENTNKAISTVLRVIPLAMAVAAVVLLTLAQIPAETALVMLAIGMFSGSIERMRQES